MAQPFGSTSFESVTAPKFRWHRTLIGQNGWCTNSRKSQCNMRPMQWINIFIKFRFNKNVLIKIQLTCMWIVRFVRESRIHVSMCFHSNRTIRCNFVIISFLESFMMYLRWNFSDPNPTVRQILYDIYLIFLFVRFSVPIRTKRTEQNRMYHIFFSFLSSQCISLLVLWRCSNCLLWFLLQLHDRLFNIWNSWLKFVQYYFYCISFYFHLFWTIGCHFYIIEK